MRDVVGRVTPQPLPVTVQRLLRDGGALTKRQLVEATGVSRSSVTTAVADLVAEGEIEQSGTAVSTGGRRSALLRPAAGVTYRALALGSTRCRSARVDGGLEVSEISSVPGGLDGDPDTTLRRLVELASAGGPAPRAIGVAVSGDLEYDEEGPARVRTGGPGWDLRALRDRVGEATGVPIVLVSAGEALAAGAAVRGSTEARVKVVARLGATVASVTVVEGEVLRGATGAPGAVGHLEVEEFGPSCTCGRSGCLDAYAGTRAVLSRASALALSGQSAFLEQRLAADRSVGLADLVEAVHAGDPAAVQLARDVGRRVGEGLAAAVAILTPTAIELSGPLVSLGDELISEIRTAVYRVAPAAATRALVVRLGPDGEACLLSGAARIASELTL